MAETIRSHWQHYVDGQWTDGASAGCIDVEDPATGEVFGREKGQEAIWNYVQSKNIGIRLNPARIGAVS